MLRRTALLLCLLAATLLGAKRLPTFEGEKILFSLRNSEQDSSLLIWEVTADLYFSNLHRDTITSLITFPIPSGGGVDSPVLRELKAFSGDVDSVNIVISHQSIESGYAFSLDLPGRSFSGVRVHYTQEVRGDSVSYILSTANTWGRALPSAEYELFVGKGISLKGSPLPEPTLIATPEGIIYSWIYTDFRPSGEFILYW